MRISKRQVMVYMAVNGLNIKGLAGKISMCPQNLSSILSRGSCQPVTAARIAEGLGVTVMDIVEEGD